MPELREFLPEETKRKLQEIKKEEGQKKLSNKIKIELIQSRKEVAKLPLTKDLGPQPEINLKTIEIDLDVLKEIEEAYQILREMYLKGEINKDDLEEIYLNPKTAPFYYNIFVEPEKRISVKKFQKSDLIIPDKLAANRLVQEIEEEKIKRPTLSWRPPTEKRVKQKEEWERWENLPKNKIYEALCQEYVKGMSLREIRHQFLKTQTDRNFKQSVLTFIRDVQTGFNPAAWLMTKILLTQPEIKKAELTAQDWQLANERFLEATRQIWQEFYYSGKWEYDKKEKKCVLKDRADLDAKVCFYLLEQAGFKAAIDKNFSVLEPGKYKPGGFTIDSSRGISGVLVEKNGTIELDNHQRGRGYETSSAKILYNLLEAGNYFSKINNKGPLRALVELTVLDDNGRLINNQEQFKNSAKTLRGLHRYMSAEKIFDFLKERWIKERSKINWKKEKGTKKDFDQEIFRKILDDELTKDEARKYGLVYFKKVKKRNEVTGEIEKVDELVDLRKKQQETIDSAKKLLFDKNESDLYKEGRLIKTKFGKTVVNIEKIEETEKTKGEKWFGGQKFLGGHDTVNADPRNFSMYLSFDAQYNSILINTNNRQLDLSKELKDLLEKYPQLVVVRGALIIKPRDGKPFCDKNGKVLNSQEFFHKILTFLTDENFVPEGQIKKFLESGLVKNIENIENKEME